MFSATVVLCILDKYCLVKWDEEDAVSVVSISRVCASDVSVGRDCSVKAGCRMYNGKILLIGKCTHVVLV